MKVTNLGVLAGTLVLAGMTAPGIALAQSREPLVRAAQKAGIKAGDVITGINGVKVHDSSDLTRALERLETGGEFTVDVVRDDKKTQSLKGKIEEPAARRRSSIRTIL